MMMMRTTSTTKSIPIADCTERLQEQQLEKQEAMMADLQDYLFYSRIVDGIQKKQERTRNIHCRYENQALIDHLTYTRCGRSSSTSDDETSIITREGRGNQLPTVLFGDVSSNRKEEERDVLFAVKQTLALVHPTDLPPNMVPIEDDALIFDIEI